MKLSISNIAWPAEHDAEMLAYLSDAGFQGLEIAPTRIFPTAPYQHNDEARQWMLHLRQDYGLCIPSMQSIWYGHTEKIFGTVDERRTLIEYTRQAIDFAETIECPNLVFGNPRNRDTDCVERDLPVALDFFGQIGEYAAQHHTVVALEPNPTIYNTRFMNLTCQAVDFTRQVASAGLKVNVDLGTIIHNGESLDYLRQIPEWINHVHISEPGLNLVEKRGLHKQLFDILREIGYDRFVSIEMGNKGDLAAVKRVIDYIAQL